MIDMNDPEVIESLKYLLVPREEKIRTQAQPFDGKKNIFIPDHKDGFLRAEIESEDEEKGMVTVRTENGDTATVKKGDILPQNPPKYEKCDDMADLTYLNDATILHNLRSRYLNWLIYTYSGLFCVAINPFKRLPVYTMKMVYYYRGKKKSEVPPHLYLIADNAYSCMMRDRNNQSMLITGESGAGKTENTKKVIQYFAFVAAAVTGKKISNEDANKPSLEDQIVSANPVLEAYGNAKTTRNNNSSRFGKFIRIHFTQQYGIAGADIESYLLEKSRITFQQSAERNYHIFYQLLSPAFPDLQKEILVEADASKYFFINQGMLTIDNVDDAQEMRDTKKAFDILNFTQQQQMDLFKCTAAVMIWGNSEWKQRPREEQAEPEGTEECEKVAKLLGLNLDDLLKCLLKPRIKVGTEFVNKGQNKDQVINAVGALSKAIYSRAFNWLVEKVNETLDVKTVKRAYFIGVLDIAGFETFDFNGFEQLCINFTNERLQQFFNNFMFVLEQEEYKKEGIVWEMMSFGLDLQACIDLIDKPLGIFSILEEECIVPKATDKTFQEKLYTNHLGKHPSFGKPKPQKGKAEAHFDIHHYAGTVSYNVTGWLEKNKDPINTTVAQLFKDQKNNALLSYLFQDIGVEEAGGGGGKKSKSGSQQTISCGHREQLNKLMKTLDATYPHFVRCIIPNEIKTGGVIDAHLVLHQLHCNGVLEGIRICRKGFPSRLIFSEFVQRYSILAPNAVKENSSDLKKASSETLKEVALDTELYRIGLTKVLFKAGVLGTLEEYRDAAISKILVMLQSYIRTYYIKQQYKIMLEQRLALSVLQCNIKAYLSLRYWGWWKLMSNIKPLLQTREREEKAREEARKKEEEQKMMAENLAALEKYKKETEEKLAKMSKENEELASQLEFEKKNSGGSLEEMNKLKAEKLDLESQCDELNKKVVKEEAYSSELNAKLDKLNSDLSHLKKDLDETKTKLNKSETDLKSKEAEVQACNSDISDLNEKVSNLTKEKKRAEEANANTEEQFRLEQDKVKSLEYAKKKLEQTLEESEANFERERKDKNELDKIKRKLEGFLKSSEALIEKSERVNAELEGLLKRKESENAKLSDELEEEKIKVVNAQKKAKQIQQRVNEVEEEIQTEKQAKRDSEKQKSDLSREIHELLRELDEANNARDSLEDIRKRCDHELNKMRRDMDETNKMHESSYSQLRKKHEDTIRDMSQQIEQLHKAKNKLEKEKLALVTEIDRSKMSNRILDKDELFQIEMEKQVTLYHRLRKE